MIKPQNSYRFLTLFVFCSLLVAAIASIQWMFTDQVKHEKVEMQGHLKSIANFQGQAITVWRNSRLWDGRLLQSEIQRELETKSLNSFNAEILAEIRRNLAALITSGHYISATLLDTKGNKLIVIEQQAASFGNTACISQHLDTLNGQIRLTDVHATGDNRKHLSVLIPVVQDQLVLGSVYLEIDPDRYLYATSPQQTPHDVLVVNVLHQIEGEKFRVLSRDVNLSNAAVQEKFLLEQRPAFEKLLKNHSNGSIEFTDRYGHQVLGYLVKIPDTPWFIVTKANLEDVLAVLLKRRNTMLLLVVMLFGLAGLVIYVSFKLQQSRHIVRSEALLRAIIEQTEEGVILFDNQGYLKLVNPAFVDMSGFSLEEMQGQGDRLLHGESSDPEENSLTGLHEKNLQKKNGEKYLAEINSSVIEIDDNRLTLSIIRDISEKKRVEEELRLLQFAVDKSHESVFLINRQSRFQYVNQSACETLGYTQDDLLTLSVSNIDPQYPLEQWDALWQEIEQKGQLTFETTHQRSDGSQFPVEIDFSYFRFKDQGYLFSVVQDITLRKQSEQALAQQTDLLEAIFNDIPDAMALADADRRIIKLNSGFMKTFGYREDEILGQLTRNFYEDEDDYIKQGKIRFHQTAEEKLAPYVVNYRRKNGEVFPGETIGVPVLDRDGLFLGFIAVIRDITSRINAEQAVRNSEAHYRAIFEQAQDAIVLVDPQTQRFIEFNEPAHKNLGYSREEFSQLLISDIELGQQKNEINEHVQKVFNTGYDAFETRHRTKLGEIKTQLVSIKRITLGDSDRFISMWKDITELKQARTEVERFFNLSVDMFSIASLDGYLLRLSPAWSRILGWSEQELLSKPWIEFVHEDDRSATENAREVMIGGERVFNFENRYRTKQGEYRWLSWNALPQEDEGLSYAVARDITEQKRLELELQQAHKMEAIGQLTGGIAHDFNNILATILGFAHLARSRHEHLSTEKLVEYLDTILQAGNRGRDLVGQMLTFSRVPSDENVPVVDLLTLVREVSRMLVSVLPSSIELVLDLEGDIPPVAIDPVKFHQIVMNLCVNARDAMQGKGILRVGLCTVEAGNEVCAICHQQITGNWVKLTIRDTGKGIDSDTQLRIFDPFFTTKQVGEGSGMGLAVVHGILKGIGGHIQLQSELGKGSEFSLLLRPEKNKKETESTTQDSTHSVKGDGQHILLVDDEPSLVRYMSELLVSEGYRVTSTTDSREALSLIESKQQDFKLLISDQTMPHFTGIELASQLKQSASSIPVLICTGYSESLDENTLKQAGVAQLLAKPVKPDLLLQSVSTLLSR